MSRTPSRMPASRMTIANAVSAGTLSYTALESVCGKDERTRVDETRVAPYYWLCRLSMAFPGGMYVGSGFLVETGFTKYDVIVTSGHCVYSQTHGWADYITVAPGATRTEMPFGEFFVDKSALRASKGWLAGGSDKKQHDYGAILVPHTGRLGAVGLWAPNADELDGRVIKNAGYPGTKGSEPYGDCWEHDGPITSVTERMLHYMNDTSGGQSGSAAFTRLDAEGSWDDAGNVCAIGVHSYGGCPNKSVRFTDEVLDQIMAWADGKE